MTDLTALVARLDDAMRWSSATTRVSPATVWCADVVDRAADDPLAGWRHALEAQQHSGERPHVAAAFVLQWWCESLATPIAYAAQLASVVLAESGAGLGFELAPGLYPHRYVLDPERVSVQEVERQEAALARGRAAYLSMVSPVVRDFAPEVKASTQQRRGLVDDMWRTALARACGRPDPLRVSCCFIYALPGAHPCSVCPRLGRLRAQPPGQVAGTNQGQPRA